MKTKVALPLLVPPIITSAKSDGTLLKLVMSDNSELPIDLAVLAQALGPALNALIQGKIQEFSPTVAFIDPTSTNAGEIKVEANTVYIFNDTWLTIASKV